MEKTNEMNEKRNLRLLCLTSGVYGLVMGIILLVAPLVILSTFAFDDGGTSAGGSLVIFVVFKLIAIALGIICIVMNRNIHKVIMGGPILLIVGGGVALVPLMGIVGGIVIIVGGAICLGSLSRFKI